MIEFKNVSYSYGEQTVIQHLDLCIDTNLSILGTSGCGKTTLLHLISGILKADEGNILINQKEVDLYRDKIGLVAQSGGVLDFKTVYENISLGLLCRKDQQRKKKTVNIAKKLKIDHYLDKYPAQISGGQKQRVALGRVLCMNPNILLLDEPFSALDEITRKELQDEVINLSKKNQTRMITVTHSIQEAVLMGEVVRVMGNNGQFIKQYDVSNFKVRDLAFYQECIEIEKEIGGLLK